MTHPNDTQAAQDRLRALMDRAVEGLKVLSIQDLEQLRSRLAEMRLDALRMVTEWETTIAIMDVALAEKRQSVINSTPSGSQPN